MKLYLIRHGQTDWNLEGRLQGRRDIPMNETGIQQIRDLGSRLKETGFWADQIVASPLLRAKVSAELIASQIGYSAPILTEDNLVERSYGLAEGEKVSPEDTSLCTRYQAESDEDLCARAKKGIAPYLSQDNKKLLIVAHGAIIKGILAGLVESTIPYEEIPIPIQGNVLWCEVDENGRASSFSYLL